MEGHGKRFGKGVIRRLAVLLGSAALLLPLAGPVGQQTGAVARYLLTMAAMTMATPAQAQTVTTLVTNGSEPVSSSLSRAFQAQAFTTGDHATGYIVTAVQIGLGIAGERSISAVIREDNGGEPGELVATLTNPISFTNYTLHTFTAPVGTALDPNTTYWLSIHEGVSDSGGGIPLQKTNNPGETGLTGWSIADNHLRRFNEMTSNNPMMPVYQHQTVWGTVTGEALRISIRGYAVDVTAPSFDSATVNDDSLTITFDEALDTTKTPATAAFNVQVDGSTVTVSTVAVSDSTVTLTLATAVTTGQSVTVAYTKPNSGDVVQDESGNELATFTAQTATNVTRPPNTPATGAPTISGTARVGEELTASTSEIMDDNGITGATFAYQWVRDDGTDEEDINGATLSTYRVTSNDGGATLKVKVSFTDDDGFDEEVISDPTATIDATDTTAPVVEYTVPTPLAVGTQVAMSPLTEDTDIASYSATGLPAWLTINATTGLITGSIPDTGSPSFTTVVTVTDTSGNSAEVTLAFPLVEGPAVVPDTTPPMVEDPAVVPDTTPPMVEDPVVVPDTTPPTVVAATLVPSVERVTLTLSEATTFRDPASNNLKGAFTVTADGEEQTILLILSTNGESITINLGAPISSSADTVVLSYDQSAAGNDALRDSAGNRLASFMWAIRGSIGDTPAPTLTSIERQTPATSPTNADSLTWRVTFSEAVENVDMADFTVGGSTATVTGVQAVSGETGVYDVTASGGDLAGYTGTVTLGFASNQNIADGADNALVSPTLTGTSNSYDVDNAAPTVTIDVPATSSAAFPATITFSEAVSGFTVNDITAENGTLSGFTPTIPGTVWTVQVTPAADGDVTLQIGANVATDAAGNANTAAAPATSTYTAPDTVAPTVTSVTRQTPATSPTNADSLTWRVTFSEAVENVDMADFTVSGSTATVTNVQPVGGETGVHDVTVSGGDLAGYTGTVTLEFAGGQNIQDAAGNRLTNTTLTGTGNSYMVDNTPPMVAYTSPDSLVVGTAVTAIEPSTAATDIASYSATGLPAGLVIDPTTGVISGSPVTASADPSMVMVTVTDTSGNSTTVRLTFLVGASAQPGVRVTPIDPSLNEGSTTSYTVTLNTQPAGPVTITPISGGSGAVSVSPASLTFTPSNWDTAQTVTVTGVDDTDTDDETVAISHNVSGYGAVTAAPAVTVTVTDSDTPGVSVEPTSVSTDEGEMATYTVTLSTMPEGGAVTIIPTSGDSGAVSVSPASLTFTPSNWDTAQTVTVTGVDDTDTDDETVAISHNVSGYGAVTAAPAVTVTVTDSDTPGVSVEPTSVSTDEGEMATYTVTLSTMPEGGAVTIIPTSGDSGAVSVSPASLTFTPSNWDTAQTVTVTGVDDTDTDDETVAISHNVSGYGAVTAAPAVTVTVTDSDTPGVSVEPTSVSTDEGEMATYTVTLSTMPEGGAVTIIPTSGDSGAVSVSPASLTFTPSNWDTAQTVTVTGVKDDDDNNERATISHNVSGYGAVTAAPAVTVRVTDSRQEEAKAVLEEVVLPDVVQQLIAQTTEVITSRLNTITSGSPGAPVTISLDKVLADTVAFLHGEREHLKNGSLEWRQAVSGRNFAFPLSGLTLAQGESAMSKENPFSSLAVWGGGDYFSYGNTIERTDVDGDGFSGSIGMDMQPIPRLVSGLALTTSRWGLDYTTDGSAEGTYKVGVTMVNPYLNWLATDQLSLWATFGYGRGEVEHNPEGDAATSRADSLTSWAGGLRFEVLPGADPRTGQGSPIALAFKVDGAASSFLDTQVQLARLAAEVSHSFSVETGLLTAALDLGWSTRSVSDKDGLDGPRQAIADKNHSGGAELAGRLNWLNTEGSVSATVDTRVLMGGGDRREWGMGGHLRLTPSQRAGEGLSLTLQPAIGVTGTRLDELWSLSGDGDPAMGNDLPGARLDAELAYGFRHGDALFTPYTEVVLEEATSTYGAGLRYGLNASLEMDLKGAHRSGANGNTENRLLLEARSDL